MSSVERESQTAKEQEGDKENYQEITEREKTRFEDAHQKPALESASSPVVSFPRSSTPSATPSATAMPLSASSSFSFPSSAFSSFSCPSASVPFACSDWLLSETWCSLSSANFFCAVACVISACCT
eukprot:1633412-Rhodomonas_salina.1